MGDHGIIALASLVDHGRLEHLEEFSIGENALVTDLGICAIGTSH